MTASGEAAAALPSADLMPEMTGSASAPPSRRANSGNDRIRGSRSRIAFRRSDAGDDRICRAAFHTVDEAKELRRL